MNVFRNVWFLLWLFFWVPAKAGNANPPVFQQEISGTVADNEGAPLPGATVQVRGTDNATSTDAEGRFSIEAPGDAVLVVSFLGFVSREVAVNNRTSIDIQLEPDMATLEEVVVVGYGEQKKVNLTGAISTVNYDEELANRPITNATQALSGKVTGVWVSQNSGSPGSDAATLRVRGIGTLNNTDPLILIDGIEGRLNELNPNDIESMTVLKDAASSAIYGSRAANGVVLVTTKQGEYDSAPQLSYNGYFGLQHLGRKLDLIDNSVEFMNMWNTAVINDGGSPLFPDDVIEAFRTGDDPYRYPNTNFFDEVFHTAPIHEHNVSVRGGSEKQRYYFSLNYLDQDGIVRQTSSQRFGLNLNLNTQITDWLELGGIVQATRKVTDRPYDNINRVMYMMYNGGYPFTPPYTRDGQFGATQAVFLQGDNAGQPIVDSRNPLPDLYNGSTQLTNTFLKGALNATVNLAEGLRFETLYSGQYNNNRNDRYNEVHSVFTADGFETRTLDYPSVLNNIRSYADEFYWAFYNTLNYDQTFGGLHNFSAIAGMQAEGLQLKPTTVQRSEPPKGGLHEVDAGITNPIAEGNTMEWKMYSYFGRINYNFDERYLFEANLRADASSRFRRGNRWGIFPSFSAGWRISEEPFMQGIGFIDQLKLRVSWGRLGNQNIAIGGTEYYYPYLVALEQDYETSYNLEGQVVPGAAVNQLVDEDLTWETTETTDIGLELGVLDNRLSFEFDYYTRTTRDILIRLPIPSLLGGVDAPIENVGEMRNDGFDLSVLYQSDPERDFSYSIGVNLSHVINEVVRFREDSPDQLYLVRNGYSYQSLYGYRATGVYQTDEEAAEHMYSSSLTPVAGDLRYEDVNGDGRLGFEDKQVLGNTIPKYNYGINLAASYKNWSLSVGAQGALGVNLYTQNPWTEPLGISGGTITTRWRDAWSPENPSNTLPRIRINDTWNRYESSFWVSNGSFLRINNVQLSYSFPEEWLERIRVKGISCYVNAQNFPSIVSSEYDGFDPERDPSNSGATIYPTPLITSFGVNVQF